MTLTQLRCLIAITEAGLNITLAARRMKATQPALSKQLRQLEDELGFKVFARRGKSLTGMTGPGARVLSRAQIIAGQADAIGALARSQAREAAKAAPQDWPVDAR